MRNGPVDATALEERELVNRMKAGDEAAFQTFADHYVPALYRFTVARLTDRQELAREAVQNTICRFIEKLDTFRGESTLFTWLCVFCRNEVAGHFRQRQPVSLEDAHLPVTLRTPEADAIASEAGSRVHDVLDHLPPRYASVLEWKYDEGLSVKEIAQRLGVGEKAAESLLTRARTAFRSMYEEGQR